LTLFQQKKPCFQGFQRFQYLSKCQRPELGIFKFLVEITNQKGLSEFVYSKLGPLLNYDPQKSKMYIETLEVYLRSGNSLQETAQTLHVHLGTVKYRLRRIREILDVDFNEAETVFNLQVALRVKRLIGKLC